MDYLFFVSSKLLWAIFAPQSILVLLICVATLLLLVGKQGKALGCLIFLCSLTVLISFLPLGQWLLLPLEQRFAIEPQLPDEIDGILVLSGAEQVEETQYWRQLQFNEAIERQLAFLQLAKRYPQAKLVFTGGHGGLAEAAINQAEVAKLLMTQFAVDIQRVQFEDQARNTAENAIFSYQMLQPDPAETWVLITTAWHMPRAIGLFCQVGWPMIPYPVDYRTHGVNLHSFSWAFGEKLMLLNTATKEWMGLLVYYLTGKTPQILPEKCT